MAWELPPPTQQLLQRWLVPMLVVEAGALVHLVLASETCAMSSSM
jgi:hypothetical protein